MAGIDYLDFDLELDEAAGGHLARVLASPTGEAEEAFELPFSAEGLENFILKVGRARTGVRRVGSPQQEAARAFGAKLYDSVFTGEIRTCFRRSLDEADRQRRGLRIRLRLSDAPGLAQVPWEYLYSEGLGRFLVLSAYTPIVRYLDLPDRVDPLVVTAPLRVLLVVSSPSGLADLDTRKEVANVSHALSELTERGLIELEVLESATLSDLRSALRNDQFHVLHFVGHGGFDERYDDGVLAFESDTGSPHFVSGHDLGTLLHDHRTLRLAILNACEGARGSAEDPFAGVAQSLVRQRIPAVVAMQFEITDAAAILFSHELYLAVLDGYPIDAALAEARKAIFTGDNDIEWGTPVLYMRARDGRVFDIATDVDAPVPRTPVGDLEVTVDITETEAVVPAAGSPLVADRAAVESTPPPSTGPDTTAPSEGSPGEGSAETEVYTGPPAAAKPGEHPTETPASEDEKPGWDAAAEADTVAEPGGPTTTHSMVPEYLGVVPETRAGSERPTGVPVESRPDRPEPTARPLTGPRRWQLGAVAASVIAVGALALAIAGGGENGAGGATTTLPEETVTVPTTVTAPTTLTVPTTVTVPTTGVTADGGEVAGDFVAARGRATVDGSAEEWATGPEVESSAVVAGAPDGPVARWRLMWDEAALYLLTLTTDADLVQPWANNPPQLWRGDSVHFELGASTRQVEPSGGPRAGDAHYLFGLTPGGQVVSAVNPSDGRAFVAGGPDARIEAAGRLLEGGYLFEIAVPWEVIGVEPEPGLDLAMNLNISDVDGAGNLRTMRSSNPARTTQNDPNIWQILVLG